MDVGGIIVVSILSALFGGFIMGIISKTINENKGYVGGFAWGFWLGILGIIVVACKTPAWQRPEVHRPETVQDQTEESWFCTNCGQRHDGSEYSCACGQNKLAIPAKKKITEETPTAPKAAEKANEEQTIRVLKEYKELMDAGIITPEEFEKKKKALIG